MQPSLHHLTILTKLAIFHGVGPRDGPHLRIFRYLRSALLLHLRVSIVPSPESSVSLPGAKQEFPADTICNVFGTTRSGFDSQPTDRSNDVAYRCTQPG